MKNEILKQLNLKGNSYSKIVVEDIVKATVIITVEHILEKLKKANPYPEDIFTPMDGDNLKKYVKLMLNNNLSPDRYSAHLMRLSWNLACDKIKKMEKEE